MLIVHDRTAITMTANSRVIHILISAACCIIRHKKTWQILGLLAGIAAIIALFLMRQELPQPTFEAGYVIPTAMLRTADKLLEAGALTSGAIRNNDKGVHQDRDIRDRVQPKVGLGHKDFPPCNQVTKDDGDMSTDPALIHHIRTNVLRSTAISTDGIVQQKGPADLKNTVSALQDVEDPFHGQHMIKTIIPNLISKLTTGPGTFFEAGALNTYNFSSTYYLEKKMGWTGLLVEMSPLNDPYEQALKHNRTNTLTAAACLTEHRQPCLGLYSLTTKESDVKKLKGKSWEIWLGGLDDKTDPQLSSKSSRSDDQKLDDQIFVTRTIDNNFVYNENVVCYPLISLLMAANLTNLDFLSLDVESKEDVLLYALPWELVDIKVIRLDLYHYRYNELPIIQFLKSKGYVFHDEMRHLGDDMWVFAKI